MKRTKKLVMCALVAAMTLSMTACGGEDTDKQLPVTESSVVESSVVESSVEHSVAESSEVESSEVESSEVESSEVAPVADGIVGAWTLNIDGGDMIAESLGDEVDGVEFTIEMSMTFSEDGKVVLEITEEQLDSMVDQMMVLSKNIVIDAFYQQMEESGVDKETADQTIMEQTGMSTEDYLMSALESQRDTLKESFTEELGEVTKNGEYKIEGNKLFIVDLGDEYDENDYVLFELSGDTLRIYNEDGSEMMPGFCQDMILTR